VPQPHVGDVGLTIVAVPLLPFGVREDARLHLDGEPRSISELNIDIGPA
jgi:hypothetical protein